MVTGVATVVLVRVRVRELDGWEDEGLEERGAIGWDQGLVRWGDQNGDVYAARDQGLGEVQEGYHVTGRGERVREDVGLWCGHVWIWV